MVKLEHLLVRFIAHVVIKVNSLHPAVREMPSNMWARFLFLIQPFEFGQYLKTAKTCLVDPGNTDK